MTKTLTLLIIIMIGYSVGLITTEIILFLILLTCLELLIHEISNSINIKK